LNRLSNQAIIEALKKAKKYDLNKEFIMLLEKELKERNIKPLN